MRTSRTATPAPPPHGQRNALKAQLPDARDVRMRVSSAPEDVALYGCECGFCFTAAVATAVACPHCGSAQDW